MRTAIGSRRETIRSVDEHAAQHRKVVKARGNRSPGRVVRIDLGDDRCAYGRQLSGVSVEFYDRVSKTGEAVDLLDVVASPVAFPVGQLRSTVTCQARGRSSAYSGL
jgi:hypothetical protein